MAVDQPKKVTCRICGTEHKAGEKCPTCEWDETAEQWKAKGDRERRKLREEEGETRPPRKLWD